MLQTKKQCEGIVKYYELLPENLSSRNQNHSHGKTTLYLPIFMHEDSKLPLKQLVDVSLPFSSTVVFSRDDQHSTLISQYTTHSASSIGKIIQQSRFPTLNSSMGVYKEISLLTGFNQDFSPKQNLLLSISALLTGSIIHTVNTTLIITTCEIYSRDANIDGHLQMGITIYAIAPSIITSCTIVNIIRSAINNFDMKRWI